jgi:hypothetical protein
MAVLAGFLLMHALWRLPWLALPLFWALVGLSLWYGRQLDLTRAYAVGRRQARSLVSLPTTWISATWALILTGALLWWARTRGWNALPGWADGPLFALLVLGFYHLGAGVRANVARYVYLGLCLCLLAVLISAVGPLRERIYLSTAVLGGGALLLSGLLGRRAFVRDLRQRWHGTHGFFKDQDAP